MIKNSSIFLKKGKINIHHFKDYSMAIKLDEVNKILFAYDIKIVF